MQASPNPDRPGAARLAGGLVCLLVALGASAALAGLGWSALPGCGPESPCARAAASAWGHVPLLGWSTAELGLVHLGALACAWLAARGRPGRGLRAIVLAGAAGSLALLGALAVERAPCPWCLTVHATHLAFAALALRGPAGRPAAGLAVWLAAALAAAAGVEALARARAARERAEAERSIERAAETIAARAATPTEAPTEEAPFTGRWRLGPEQARVRIVVFSDYQCPDCKRVEGELQAVLARHPGEVSLSAKHYPFCSDCNEVARRLSFSPHPDACRAARLAESAGALGGDEAFWRAHAWLFERSGAFADADARTLAGALGLDPEALVRGLAAPESLAPVQADIAEGTALGLRTTPFVFLNGVELRAWTLPGALGQAVDRLLATDLPAADARADRPPPAAIKLVEDWLASPRAALPAGGHWTGAGSGEALVDVVAWGDQDETSTRALERELAPLLAARPWARYSFRHFPLDRDANPHAPRTQHPGAGLAACLAEAAARVAGPEAFWNVHRWTLAHDARDEGALRAALRELGLDDAAVWRAAQEAAARAAVAEDARQGLALGLRSVPFLVVDGRAVPRWRAEGVIALAELLDRAHALALER